ncbi:MAG TPA: hypothetical protein VIV06_03140 [Candidatus Limnocylindrales bacterium]
MSMFVQQGHGLATVGIRGVGLVTVSVDPHPAEPTEIIARVLVEPRDGTTVRILDVETQDGGVQVVFVPLRRGGPQ